jgi:hypothetical protein
MNKLIIRLFSTDKTIIFVHSLKRFFIRRKMLRHGSDGFNFVPKEGVLRIFVALKNLSPRLGLNPRTLGQISSTLIIILPRRLTSN